MFALARRRRGRCYAQQHAAEPARVAADIDAGASPSCPTRLDRGACRERREPSIAAATLEHKWESGFVYSLAAGADASPGGIARFE